MITLERMIPKIMGEVLSSHWKFAEKRTENPENGTTSVRRVYSLQITPKTRYTVEEKYATRQAGEEEADSLMFQGEGAVLQGTTYIARRLVEGKIRDVVEGEPVHNLYRQLTRNLIPLHS